MDKEMMISSDALETRFGRAASAIARLLEEMPEDGAISEDGLCDVISGSSGIEIGNFNKYPSDKKGRCCKTAFFLALKESSRIYPHLDRGSVGTFGGMLEALVGHMQGTCAGYTECAVLITDSWSQEAYESWADNIKKIASEAHIEIFLITGRKVTAIRA